MVYQIGFVLSGIKLRQVQQLIETAVVREYARWCERTAAQAASYSIKIHSLRLSFEVLFQKKPPEV
jgi:hypothetical protein